MNLVEYVVIHAPTTEAPEAHRTQLPVGMIQNIETEPVDEQAGKACVGQ